VHTGVIIMGFGGGGGGALPNHQHTSVPLTGGPLDFNNVTIASMAQGDLTYSNGAALQILNLGNATETLTVNAGATAPEWTAGGGGGGSMTLIDNTQVGATTTTIDTTFASISGDSMAEIYAISSGCNGGFDIDVQLYDEGTNLLTSADYSNHGYTIISGVQTLINTTGQTAFNAVPGVFEPHYVIMHITLGRCGGVGAPYFPRMQSFASGDTGVSHIGGTFSNATKPTGIAGIKFGVSASNSIENGTYLAIYQVTNA